MLAGDDSRAGRHRGAGGVWVINVLTSALVAVLSLYVFRAAETRADARAAFEMVEALPGQIGGPPARAADRPD